MDPRLIALMQMAQRAKQPVRRFSDGDLIDDGLSSGVQELIGNMDFGGGDFNVGDFDASSFDIGDLSDLSNLGDLTGGSDAGETVDMLTRGLTSGGAGEDIDLSKLVAADDGTTEGIQDLINQLYDTRADETGYGNLISASEDAERADRYGGLYEQAMSGLTDAMQGGTYNAARDSQAANEYLERVMGVPRSEIDEAYASGAPRFVNLSNFQGGKSFATGRDDTATNKTAGTEVKYDSKGNLVDTKGNIISKGPGTETSKVIKEIIEKYTGGTTDKTTGGTKTGTTGGTQTGTKTGQQSSLSSLLPLLLMMMMMNRQQQPQTTGQAVIPKLSADRSALPYQQIQQAPGYRPGQGGVQYMSNVNYRPMATGGIADLSMMAGGGTPVGGKLLKGPGDGVSDSIPATIGGTQPARLARGEFVVDARTVSELGNGSTEAGAEKLYKMMDRVHSARKRAGRGKDSGAAKYLPA